MIQIQIKEGMIHMKTDKTFEAYQDMLRKIAWSFHRTTGIEWEELYGEACLAYVKALKTYDAEQAATSTWIYHVVKNHLIFFARKQKVPEDRSKARRSCTDYRTPEYILSFHQKMLPPTNSPWKGCARIKDLHTVVNMVFQSPSEFIAHGGRWLLKKKLTGIGWSKERIKQTFDAVHAAL
jgi:RNA polymerase sigma factor (sigma-70 family)